MSDAHDLHGAPETSHSNLMLSILGALGTLLLFALIIVIAYYIPAKEREPVNAEIVSERQATLAELKAKETELATSYGVVDQTKGVVRIPIERAMELVVPRLNETESSK
ncbi:hypothetical protein [Cerasicoccus arenae]|uniref:Uncharacterized protein n=1 Tax=Cerasicoccus arenae TaxID=424488 RepID=A0A8J3GE20_9BACT|nr:hypothetical protein [Cerasicoccus arenae]MBK1858542.1 hypothetical protein [Cerasicoccus arenae]GHC06185.1 hypothetical protein GCM10007047_24080 [Cerasicoccus arenae]